MWRSGLFLGCAAFLAAAIVDAPIARASTTEHCHAGPGGAGRICIRASHYHEDVCRALKIYADAEGLPRAFFARLIWQESGFQPGAVSHKGAQGIAQFMPATAKRRGLRNPYNPAEALAASASFLNDLRREFGNLGLAAAAYNAGEGRVRRVVAGASRAPRETRHYVANITGHSVRDWAERPPRGVRYNLAGDKPFFDACVKMAKSRKFRGFGVKPPRRDVWGVEIASHNSSATARRLFETVRAEHPELLGAKEPRLVKVRNRSRGSGLRYSAQVAKLEQGPAISLCRKLRRNGAVCRVLKN